MCLCTFLGTVLTTAEVVSNKGMNVKPKMFLLSVTAPVYVIVKKVMEG